MDIQLKFSMFSGEQKDWVRWSRTFMAKAKLRGYKEVLTGKETAPTQNEQDYEDWLLKNDTAYAELLISCPTDICFGIIDNCKTAELPDGDAQIAWKSLNEKFEPKTKANLIKTKREFTECVLKEATTDPDVWIKNLEFLRRSLETMGYFMSDMDFMIHILQNLPDEYENAVELLEYELEEELLDIEKIKIKLRTKYERIIKKESKNSGERALLSKQEHYKGTCYVCGKYGHRGTQCKLRKNHSEQKKNDGKHDESNPNSDKFCKFCKKKGHTVDQCFKLKKKLEKENANVTQEREVVLNICENNASKEEIWLGDSGASSHMTFCDTHMYDIKPIQQTIIVGNGSTMTATKIGNLKMIATQKNGKEVTFTLNNVKFVPGLHRNLLSIGRS